MDEKIGMRAKNVRHSLYLDALLPYTNPLQYLVVRKKKSIFQLSF